MKSLRNSLLLFAAVLTVTAACEEFPEALEPSDSSPRARIVPIDWPDVVALEDTADILVELRDDENNVIVPNGLSLSWSVGQGGERFSSQQQLGQRIAGVGLGEVEVTVSLSGGPFQPAGFDSTVTVVLAGVGILSPSKDTTVTARGDEITFQGRGKDAYGANVAGSGLSWTIGANGDGVLSITSQSSDQMVATASGEGVDTVFVSHTLCAGQCVDTVVVTVDQHPTQVQVTPAQDTVVAEDVISLSTAAEDANGFTITTESYVWTSTDEAVATVDGSGNVTAVGTGSVDIIATAENGVADTSTIEVLPSGVIEVQLTDAPADLLESAMVYFGGLYLIDNQAANGRRYIVDTPFAQDMLLLTDSNLDLGDVRVPVGTYGTVFLQVDSARVTLKAGYTFTDGTSTMKLDPPAESADSLEAPVSGSATLAANDTVSVIIDFDVDNSFPMPEPDPTTGEIDGVSFTPETRVIKEDEAGTLSGAVSSATEAVNDLTMKAVRTDVPGDTVFTRTDDVGAYSFRYLVPGTYTVSMPAAPACHVANPASIAGQSVPTSGALTGVNFSVDQVTIDSVVISPTGGTINAIGYTRELTADPYQGTTPLDGLALTWSSLNADIATVSSNGVVTGVATGTAQIVATSCAKADTVDVLVQQVPAEIMVDPSSADIEAGQTQQFTAVLQDSAGVEIPGATFVWTSSDTLFATVDASGLATAIKSGSVEIMAEHVESAITGSAALGIAIAAADKISMAGGNLGCLLTAADEVICWGQSPWGGVGLTSPSNTWDAGYRPQVIDVPAGDYTDIATAYTHACALNAAGDIYCWGEGWDGQLGDGNSTSSTTPVLVSRPVGVTFNSVAAGAYFTCATTTANDAYCWGTGANGRLGNQSYAQQNFPSKVFRAAGVDFVKLAVSDQWQATVCGLGSTGRVYCWGYGGNGEIGNNGFFETATPSLVSMPTGVTFTDVVAGDNMCAHASDGTVWCWGYDTAGNIDHSDQYRSYGVPTQVGTKTFAEIGYGADAICGITSAGAVECAGAANWWGQWGDGTTGEDQASQWEAAVPGLVVDNLDGGGLTTCAVTVDGDPYCWGWKGWGALGNGDQGWTAEPLNLGLTGVVDVARFGASWSDGLSCALTDAPDLFCWETIGPLNGFTVFDTATPTSIRLPAGETFTGVDVGNRFVCVLTGDGDIYCRGDGGGGKLGDGNYAHSNNAWVKVLAPTGVTFSTVELGWDHACAMGSDGTPYCWGANWAGQLGDATYDDRGVPTAVAVTGGFTFDQISVGLTHTCATSPDNVAFCWGQNDQGRLGIGFAGGTYNSPQQVQTAVSFASISAGQATTCALDAGGAAYCWGNGGDGRIGDNTQNSSSTPVAVTGGYVFDEVYASEGGEYSCGVEASGLVQCWGANYEGQYGTAGYGINKVPVAAMGGMLVDQVKGGYPGLCAVDTAGELWCVGHHWRGATGVGLYAYITTPVRVGGSGSN